MCRNLLVPALDAGSQKDRPYQSDFYRAGFNAIPRGAREQDSFDTSPSCFYFFCFNILCAQSESTTIAPAMIAVSFITSLPAPLSSGNPCSPLPKSGTHTSGVVTRKESVPTVMIMASPAPTRPILGRKYLRMSGYR